MTVEERAEYVRLLAAAKVAATLAGDARELDELYQLYELDQPNRGEGWYPYRLDELRFGLKAGAGLRDRMLPL